MNLTDIINHIEEIEKLIFDFNIKEAMQQFAKLTEVLIQVSGNLPPSELAELFLIIKELNAALLNKDYLLLNDILEYELKPFTETNLS
ncbi:MAG TPA: hypothetical protein VEA58_12705 [Anaerovoracaceae bacterium]|nr:hypothetical protein [Anaerovoracaceae bacterium]